MFGLLLAILRGLPGPVFFPVRLLATIYVDVFRALPGILVIYRPRASASRPPDRGRAEGRVLLRGRRADARSTRPTCPRSTGPASSRSTRASRRPPGRSACRSSRRCASWSCPQAVRRVIPPLLNDFIGLQKDTVLVSYIGVVEIFRAVADPRPRRIQLHALRRDRPRVPRRHDPAGAVHGLADRPRARQGRPGRRPALGRRGMAGARDGRRLAPARAVDPGLHKSFGELEVLEGIDLEVAEHEVVALIGASGSGKSTLLRCINLSSRSTPGGSSSRARRSPPRASTSTGSGAGSASCSSRSTCSRT